MKQSLCQGWLFRKQWDDGLLAGPMDAAPVRLPHTVRELPLHQIDPADYQMVCGYVRTLTLDPDLRGKRVFLRFDGAGHIATLYVNGQEVCTHRCGYTAFCPEITDFVDFDRPNHIALKLDSRENPAVPPFGFVIDYLTYGGLYREAWLEVKERSFIADVFVTTPAPKTAEITLTLEGASTDLLVDSEILDGEGNAVWQAQTHGAAPITAKVPGAKSWHPDHPALYTLRTTLSDGEKTLDRVETVFGFRKVEFRADGFYLNGKKFFLRGLNRHQSWPYVGYAAPKSLQEEDARILKEELRVNAVRTSHYPQSQYFIDACDRLGLLVFTELPGWQHIGDEAWKDQAVENVREMVLQYRNHPSIFAWGVRINESLDDDPFYTRTNTEARLLDPSRPTTGVRNFTKSHLLEDVYSYNDFSHTGDNPGVTPKKSVTPDMGKALLITECNGHMFPTKPYDPWRVRQEHALRHAAVQNDALADGLHAGCFGWCMFDYPTHPDFGSGDRICYHGVMDAFRNPKLAAAFFASQGEGGTVLEVASSMDIGDYPAGQIGDVYVFTNADSVKLYKDGHFVAALKPSRYTALPHPPLVVDDTIGQMLEEQEGYPHEQAELVRECLLAAKRYGVDQMPLKYKAKLAWCMARYRMTYDDAVRLYGKYVGSWGGWGGQATGWRFDAIRDGEVAASVTRRPSAVCHLEVKASSTVLREGDSYDMAAVRFRILDENNMVCPYLQVPVTFSLTGEAELVGPGAIAAEGGMGGTYVRTLGRAGAAVLRISAPGMEPVSVEFQIEKGESAQ